MKKNVLLLLSAVFVFFLMACDSDAVQPALFRLVNNLDKDVYIALGRYDGTVYLADSNWVTAAGGKTSDFIEFSAGKYFICYDFDEDHSSIQIPSAEYLYIPGAIYSIVFDPDGIRRYKF